MKTVENQIKQNLFEIFQSFYKMLIQIKGGKFRGKKLNFKTSKDCKEAQKTGRRLYREAGWQFYIWDTNDCYIRIKSDNPSIGVELFKVEGAENYTISLKFSKNGGDFFGIKSMSIKIPTDWKVGDKLPNDICRILYESSESEGLYVFLYFNRRVRFSNEVKCNLEFEDERVLRRLGKEDKVFLIKNFSHLIWEEKELGEI